MKIEPGYWRCRNNSRARILCTDAPGRYPVRGYLVDGGDPKDWIITGWFIRHEGIEHGYDLIEPWRDEPEQSEQALFDQLNDLLCEMGQRGIHIDKEALWAQVEASEACRPKQPVRVSGWARRYPDGSTTGLWNTEKDAKGTLIEGAIAVYVTGVEGVGPEGEG